MNKTLIFLIISTGILVLSAIVICTAPIINKISIDEWNPSKWKNLNCKIIADKEKEDNTQLDEIQKMRKYKYLCYRQKAMYGLEYSAFIINIILAFVCADLTLLHYLNVGKDFEKKTGLIGIISGIIGFIITLVYVCYSGYIFNNDVAYGYLDFGYFDSPRTSDYLFKGGITKLYSNGAIYKREGESGSYKAITAYENEKEENSEYIRYKDLNKKQYNYDSDYYETYNKVDYRSTTNGIYQCNIVDPLFSANDLNNALPNCEYIYNIPDTNVENKYLHDRWLTSLILAVIIVALNLILAIFGFLLFKNTEEIVPSSEQTPIVYKK